VKKRKPTPEPRERRRRPGPLIVAVAVALLAFLAFARVVGADYVSFDDPKYVTENPHVARGLTAEGLRWAFTSGHASNWHPVTWISHMLDAEVFGPGPAGPHAVNVLLHAASAAVLFLVFFRTTGATYRSAFVAALFAVHPLHVESVAWIAERKDVLSTLFGFLGISAYISYAARPRAASYLLVTLLFTMALLSKPMWVTFPFLLLLLDTWPLGRLGLGSGGRGSVAARRLLVEKLPWVALSAASSAVTYLVQRAGGAMEVSETLTLPARLANALVAYVRYLGKTIWPFDLAVFYPHAGESLPAWQVAGAAAILVAVTVAVLRKRSHPYLAAGWLWYLGALLPVIGLVQVGTQAIADRYTYVPLVGIFVIVAWGVPDLLTGWRRALPYAAGAVLAVLFAATVVQTGTWKDTRTLFTHAIEVSGNLAGFRSSLGYALQSEGKTDEAIAEYREALRLDPAHMPAIIDLAAALTARGELDEAIALSTRGLSIRSEDAELQNNFGVALKAKGQLAEAEARFREAARIRPEYATAWFNLGTTLASEGKSAEALEPLTRALALEPRNAGYHANLGAVLAGLGRMDEAESRYRQAIELDPGSARARNNLGVLLAGRGRHDQAIPLYEEAIRIDASYASPHANLAKSLLATGDPARAWRAAQRAERLGARLDPAFAAELARVMPAPPE
jgi:Flp pilus assembly protein TadD